jgi:hypothetical protein
MEQSSCEGMISDVAITGASKGFCPVGITFALLVQELLRSGPFRLALLEGDHEGMA